MTYSTIVFKQISVQQMSGNSGVFVGNNDASLWGSFGKQQTGVQADGDAVRNRTYFRDNDVVDMVAIGPSAFASGFRRSRSGAGGRPKTNGRSAMRARGGRRPKRRKSRSNANTTKKNRSSR
ncbi:hypothetical protein [Paenibacillus flagellatus]|uniref:Uncharacterized protein n=1 Tax=Paenibacillus flagellatus TaxID=2211139 RepID=A0A2V5KKU7_9BACL|nr:hypothetical protein [Paenibacillus flagellatus]PYI55450.1 hypothetical protein DLM86_06860 [Paenibacillus flagellatus]